jgi:hypothetical protein
MAIPRPPTPIRSGTRRAVLLVSLLFGVLSSTYALLSWRGVGLPEGLRPPLECPATPAAACPSCPACATPSATGPEPEPKASPGSAASVPSEPPERFVVCEATSGTPLVTRLRLTQTALPVLGIHCGTSVHLVAIDQERPRRMLRIDGLAVPPGLSALPGALLARDISGDGHVDLVVGTLFRDEHESPRSGALHQLRGAPSGGFEAPRLLAPLSVGAVAAGAFEPGGRLGLAVLRLEDARLARANQLLVLRGGPAPLKSVAFSTAVGADRLAVVDLDLNGRSELVLAGAQQAAELATFDDQGRLLRRSALDVAAAFELLTADMDGDGHEDVVFAAADARVILASREPLTAARSIGSLADWRYVQALDWNGDHKLDLIGQRGQALWGLIQTNALVFEPREITKLPAALTVHAALALAADSKNEAARLVVVSSHERAHSPVELQVVSVLDDTGGPARSAALPDSPLSQHSMFP